MSDTYAVVFLYVSIIYIYIHIYYYAHIQANVSGGVTLKLSLFKQHYATTQAPLHQHVLFGALLELLLVYCRYIHWSHILTYMGSYVCMCHVFMCTEHSMQQMCGVYTQCLVFTQSQMFAQLHSNFTMTITENKHHTLWKKGKHHTSPTSKAVCMHLESQKRMQACVHTCTHAYQEDTDREQVRVCAYACTHFSISMVR
jgi:hypothetical protein